MKISNETLSIIANFASINQNIHVAAGNKIKTKTPATLSMMASATIQEEFPVDFSIYELSKLLNVLNLFEDPDIEFHEGHLTVEKHKSKASFVYTNKTLVDAVMDYTKEIKSPEPVIRFTLEEGEFKRIKQSAKLFDVTDINISSHGNNTVRVTATGAAMSKINANKFTIDIDAPDTYQDNVSLNIKLEILKFLPGDYDVSISIIELQDRKLAMMRFKNMTFVDSEVEYVVAGDVV